MKVEIYSTQSKSLPAPPGSEGDLIQGGSGYLPSGGVTGWFLCDADMSGLQLLCAGTTAYDGHGTISAAIDTQNSTKYMKMHISLGKWIIGITSRLVTFQVECVPIVLVQLDPLSDTSR